MVQNGTEGQAVSPGSAEVCDLYAVIFVGDALTPLEQRLAGVHKVLKERNLALVRMNTSGFMSVSHSQIRSLEVTRGHVGHVT